MIENFKGGELQSYCRCECDILMQKNPQKTLSTIKELIHSKHPINYVLRLLSLWAMMQHLDAAELPLPAQLYCAGLWLRIWTCGGAHVGLQDACIRQFYRADVQDASICRI